MVRTLTLTPERSPEGSGPFTPQLRLLYSAGEIVTDRIYPLPPGPIAIGREPSQTQIAIPGDAHASRTHACLFVSVVDRTVHVNDAKSRNGTFVGGERVEDLRELADGDVIRAGSSLFLLRLRPLDEPDAEVPELVGVSAAARRLRSMIARVAPEEASILILGETGSGKEVIARAVHRLSRRRGELVAVNSSAIPHELAESELFGHAANAFTGAREHEGRFRAARGGTLFLDEVGDLPLALQPKLLRAVEDKRVTPIGSTTPIACETRIISATNRDLEGEVAAGRFRADLFARLSQIEMRVPPLSARREDVLVLLGYASGPSVPSLSVETAEQLVLHAWPHNVREVFKVATRLRLFGAEGLLGAKPERGERAERVERVEPETRAVSERRERSGPPGKEELEALMIKHRGVVQEVATELGCSRRQVGRWLELHGMDKARFRAG